MQEKREPTGLTNLSAVLLPLETLPLLGAVILAAIITVIWPGIQAYRQGLNRQLS